MTFTFLSVDSTCTKDIYEIQITYNNGDTNTFTVNTNKGNIRISQTGIDSNRRKALVQLLLRKGLINQDSTTKCINLGRLIEKDGNLEDVEGLHYVCSDIHGMYSYYMAAKNALWPDDTLYVLGDAMDRGDYGIDIIQDIMRSRGKNRIGPKVKYILGNHDIWMLEWIDIFKKKGLTDKEIVEYYECRFKISDYWNSINSYYERKLGRSLSEEEKAVYSNELKGTLAKIEAFEKRIGKHLPSLNTFSTPNIGARPTILGFYSLSKEEQEQIISFLEGCNILETHQFGSKQVSLVHSAPPYFDRIPPINKVVPYWSAKKDNNLIISMTEDGRAYTFSNCPPVSYRYNLFKQAGYTTIHGHTSTDSRQVEIHPDGDIAIDTDAQMRGGLSVYCIETGEVFCVDHNGIRQSQVKVIADQSIPR